MAQARSPTGQQPIRPKGATGKIILRTPRRRAIFIAGLGGAAILVIIIAQWSSG